MFHTEKISGRSNYIENRSYVADMQKLPFRGRRRHVRFYRFVGNVRHSWWQERGGGFLSLVQPSGFFFVGIGPVGGTSFPFELTATRKGEDGFHNDNPSPLFPPPLLQHHPLSPIRQWTVGPPRREKLNRERATRRKRQTKGERGCTGLGYISENTIHTRRLKSPFRNDNPKNELTTGESAMDSLVLLLPSRSTPSFGCSSKTNYL